MKFRAMEIDVEYTYTFVTKYCVWCQ